jgi:hypothetical protein
MSAKAGLPPSASQNVADTHETPRSSAKAVPAGAGTGCTLHVAPFQVSASGTIWPESFSKEPTASQNADDVQDNERRPGSVEPDGLGTDWIAHEAPFHDSARMTPIKPLLVCSS